MLWARRLRRLMQHRQADADIRDELAFHREMKQRELEAAGVPSAEASCAAARAMGNVLIAREDARSVWTWSWLDTIWRNIRHGARILRNQPTFALTSIVTLGLCIGANTAAYTLVDWLLIRPLPYPNVDRMAWLQTYAEQGSRTTHMRSQNGRAFLAVAEQATTLDVGAVGGTLTVNLVNGDRAIAVEQQRLSASMFQVLGVSPFAGRGFDRDEDRDGGPTAVVLSYHTWLQLFAGDIAAIGTRVQLRGEPYTVVGVMPPDFRTNAAADIWTPLRASITGEGGGNNYAVVARLKNGMSWPAARNDVEAIGQDLFTRVIPAPGVTRRFELVPMQDAITSAIRRPLFMLSAAVLVVLLIGCVNLAGLQLARAIRRTPEIATRMAVGGGRVAIVAQLLAESLVIAVGGGLLGLVVGELILRAYADEISIMLPSAVRLDSRVFIFTAATSLLTTLVFGLIPALKASRVDVRSMIVQGVTVGADSHRTRQLIVISEVALTVVLLVGAGLFLRTFQHFEALQPGFDDHGLLAASLSLQDVRYDTSAAVNRLFDKTLTRIRELPGVESAAVGLTMPYQRALNNPWWRSADHSGPAEVINMTYVTPDFFRTLGMPVVLGRTFTDADTAGAPRVAIVNQAFVRHYKFGPEILGYELDARDHIQAVGVVGDVPQTNGGLFGFEPIDSIPAWYIPAAQTSDALVQTVHTWFSPSWVVRTSRGTGSISAEMQRAVKAVDPLLPFNRFRTVDDFRGEAFLLPRAAATLFATLAALAVLLSAIGLYGIMATSVSDRARELGLRIALGSNQLATFTTAAWPGAVMTVAGTIIGLALARGSAILMRSFVWGVQTTDPTTFAVAALVGIVISGLAVLIPTLRVLRLNPIATLRSSH